MRLKSLPSLIAMFRSALCCLMAAGVVSCATSASHLSELKVGMPRQDVIKTLGQPHSSEHRNDMETLYFNLSTNRVAEGLFIGVMRPLNIGKRFYKVELVDGLVKSYYQTEKP